MLTTDETDANPGQSSNGRDAEYEFSSTWALRGTEGRTITKWQKDGWEPHTQKPGTLRTEITFRRVKPKNPWQQFVAFAAPLFAAFGRLKPKTQILLAVSCVLVLLGLVAGIVVASVLSESTPEPIASTAEAAGPDEQPVDPPSQSPTPQAPTTQPPPAVAPYVYQGPQYEFVVADENLGPAKLTQYWVVTSPFDYSTDEYKNQIRLIIEDVARKAETTELMVEVVTDREVAEAEAVSTYQAFIDEHGSDYAVNAIPEKEVVHWAASYRGGVDPNSGRASSSTDAYEILWRPYATSDLETWKPALDG